MPGTNSASGSETISGLISDVTTNDWTVVSVEEVRSSLDEGKTINEWSWGESSTSAEITLSMVAITLLTIVTVGSIWPAVLALWAWGASVLVLDVVANVTLSWPNASSWTIVIRV